MTAQNRGYLAARPARIVAGTLLALLTACMGVDGDETDLGLDREGEAAPDEDSETVGTLVQAVFGNTCQDADIRVFNALDYSITVQSMDYYNYSDGEWRWEDLSNHSVSPDTLWFWTEDLGGSDGDLITSFNLNYECHGSHQHSYHINTPDQTCSPGRVYLLEVP